MTFSIGSVSHGTLKTDDLLNAFADELETRAEALERLDGKWMLLIADARIYAEAVSEDHLNPDGLEHASELIQELDDALNQLCPDYVYFGAHEGDGSDFGFWPSIQSLEEDVRAGEVLKVDDLGQVPNGHQGIVMQVSDHGNVAVYSCDGTGPTELWSCV